MGGGGGCGPFSLDFNSNFNSSNSIFFCLRVESSRIYIAIFK